ncbi:peptidylprolyl isomerase [Leptolyngbya sp. 'hensonii']|uniref:peptidylprolyl isomerase n=1 Tax=Leptolyngbya sp. 'hensonii' TaxID=1922337 RepID=UPI00095013CD|nr:peptidylprolyl isomerase [Leptolyngbya sp. 'hensonii']OLP16131.1 peptidylprolyl isomerase [Leptolyngbya sp. 'hensonii']
MRFNFRRWFVVVFLVSVLFLPACVSDKAVSESSSTTTSTPRVESPETAASASPSSTPSPESTAEINDPRFADMPRLVGKATVQLTIKDAPVTIVVDGTNAPLTAGNFVDLVQRGVYNGLVFHRVVREPQPFVVQGGDPQSKNPDTPAQLLGTGGFVDPATGQPRYIPLEIKPVGAKVPLYSQTFETASVTKPPALKHTRGAVAMARSQLPDSASSQFYITLADLDFLDGNYAVFGYVTQGMEVVDKIQQGDRIQSATVTQGLENLKVRGKS